MNASIRAKTEKRIENKWITAEESIKTAKAEADEINTATIFTAECEKSRMKAEARRRDKNIIWKTEHIKATNERETSNM